MRYAHLYGDQLPEHEQSRKEMDPDEHKVLMEDIEHGVQAVCDGQLVRVSSDSIKQV
jgi:hypothetical protein